MKTSSKSLIVRLNNKIPFVTSILTAFVAMAVGYTTAANAEHVFNLKQQVADAYFSSTDSTGCISTDVSVVASKAAQRVPPEKSQPSSGVFVSISQYNYCEGTQLLSADNGYGGVQLGDQDFLISANLDSASLNAITTVQDYVSGGSFDVSINLTWTATGPLGRTRLNSFTRTPGCKMITRLSGTFRPVEASGTVEGAMNFTPEPPLYADLGSQSAGDITFGCQ
jgi:hypothetical protein